jgi:hypothetical protein
MPRQSSDLESVVVSAEADLLDTQVAMETLRIEVANFTRLHHTHVGPLHARLDELEALIAETVAALSGKPEDIQRAYEARSKISQLPNLDEPPTQPGQPPQSAGSAGAAGNTGQAGGGGRRGRHAAGESAPAATGDERAKPGAQARKLYRELARRAHPDLVQDPAERQRRGEFIGRVNDAYRRGDMAELQRLGEEWTVTASPAPAPDSPQRSMWLRGRLIWLRARIAELSVERETLLSGPIGSVLADYEYDSNRALREVTAELTARIQQREAELTKLLGG